MTLRFKGGKGVGSFEVGGQDKKVGLVVSAQRGTENKTQVSWDNGRVITVRMPGYAAILS